MSHTISEDKLHQIHEALTDWPDLDVAERVGVGGELIGRVAPDYLPQVCRALWQLGLPLTSMVATDERQLDGCFGLYYSFHVDDNHTLYTVEARVSGDNPVFPSVTPIIPAAAWYEREAQDMFGLCAEGHPDPRPLILHESYPLGYHPLRKDVPADQPPPPAKREYNWLKVEGEGVFDFPVGPIHAGIIEPGNFQFSSLGEVILRLEGRLFFTHRGIEKVVEGWSVTRGLYAAERICGVCAVSHAVAYAQAVEALAGVEAPPRARYLRTILLELERLYNHIGDIGNIAAGIGFAFATMGGGGIKERLQRLNERLTGHRFMRGVIALGGTRFDLTGGGQRDLLYTLDEEEREFSRLVNVMASTDSVQQRLSGAGILTKDAAHAFGAVGIAARASGITRDSRRYHPHAAYPELGFKVVSDNGGDVKARTMVRIREVAQSLSLIRQAVEQLPAGPLTLPLSPLPAHRSAVGIAESPRGEVAHWLMTGPGDTIFRYRIRSASYANWPVVPLTAPGNMVPDFPLINKSFELCYSCCDR